MTLTPLQRKTLDERFHDHDAAWQKSRAPIPPPYQPRWWVRLVRWIVGKKGSN